MLNTLLDKDKSDAGPLIQKNDMLARQLILSIPAIVLIIYCFINHYMTLIAVAISVFFVAVSHLPIKFSSWKWLRLFLLSVLFYAFLYHMFPGFNHVRLNNISVSDSTSISLWIYIDLALVLATFSLTFFIKDHRYKTTHIEQADVQVIQLLTPKHRSKVIVNCWMLSMLLFTSLYLYFNLGTIQLKYPLNWEVWFALSLLITALSQEFFIRGELQYSLTENYGLIGVVIASAIGGMFFYAVDPRLGIIMAAVGMISGYAYYRTQLIISSILINISILIFHILFLSYPYNFEK